MGSLSKIRTLLSGLRSKTVHSGVLQRSMSGGHEHKILPFQPSRWQWNKFKDYMNYYLMLGIIPVTGLITYTNVFIGPATLSEIPEGYTPKHWEYYRHPITRFIARYILNSPQQDYEKYLSFLYEEEERRRLRKLEEDFKNKLAERKDYQAYYYRPVTAKYHRHTKSTAEYLETLNGD